MQSLTRELLAGMSRLLTLLLPYKFDDTVGRHISLERNCEESQEGYYKTLEARSQSGHEGKHDVKPWLDRSWGARLRSYKVFEELGGTIAHGNNGKGDRVRAEALKRQQPHSVSGIEAISPPVV